MAPLLRPQAGAGIMELIDKGLTDVKAKYIDWVDPDTKKCLNIHYIAFQMIKRLLLL